MPPDGYESVTLSEETLAALDEWVTDGGSYNEAIQRLLDAAGEGDAVEDQLQQLRRDVDQVPGETAELVTQRLPAGPG